MSANTQAWGGMGSLPRKPRKGYWERMGGKFLLLSIAFHVLFIAAAAYYIIQIVVPPKQHFISASPSANSVEDTARNKTSVRKLTESSSAPTVMRPVAITGSATLTIPTPPVDFSANAFVPASIPGINGANPFGPPGLSGGGPGGGPGGPGGEPQTHFGGHIFHPGMFAGTFYDLKFLRNGQPAPDVGKNYALDITHYVMNGWHDSELHKYLRSPNPLYTSQVFYPVIDTNDGPKAFQSPKPESPGKWIVVYKGQVSPPETGIYHFVAAGDDDMIIRFNDQTVLFHCEHIPTPPGLQGEEYHYDGERLAYARSLPLNVTAGQSYPVEILIGDDIPTKTFAKVLIEKEGVTYQRDAGGGPILPVFAVGPVDKVLVPDTETPAHLTAPLWQGKATNLMEDLFGQ